MKAVTDDHDFMDICAWTGFVWWCCLAIVLPWLIITVFGLWPRNEHCELPADDDLPANWQELDSRDSYYAATAEIKRKTR